METCEEMENHASVIAKRALFLKAIKLNPDNPFLWASGFQMPIYNDNRLFLGEYSDRREIADSFMELLRMNQIRWFGIAGTSTAGISPATTLADITRCPLIYVRDKPKNHGLKNRIEGIDAEKGLEGRKYVLIEDLVSTGGSSIEAVQAIRDADGICNHCLSIFDYGLDKAKQAFETLTPRCEFHPILTYDNLLRIAKEAGYITPKQAKMLEEWRADPFNWGANHGFPKVEKK